MSASGSIWQNGRTGGFSNDLSTYRRLFQQQAERWHLSASPLGDVDGEPLMFYRSANAESALPHLLVAAGFHGEEPAGVWGILAFLQAHHPHDFRHLGLSFLPLINAHGFSRGLRINRQGMDVNRGFSIASNITAEGNLLQANAALLRHAARDGGLTCHEDLTSHQGYVYSYEQREMPGRFSVALRDSMARHFPLVTTAMADGYPCHNGIIFNQPDDSFEYKLFTLGVARVACTETPGQCEFDVRVTANAALVKQFLDAPAGD